MWTSKMENILMLLRTSKFGKKRKKSARVLFENDVLLPKKVGFTDQQLNDD